MCACNRWGAVDRDVERGVDDWHVSQGSWTVLERIEYVVSFWCRQSMVVLGPPSPLPSLLPDLSLSNWWRADGTHKNVPLSIRNSTMADLKFSKTGYTSKGEKFDPSGSFMDVIGSNRLIKNGFTLRWIGHGRKFHFLFKKNPRHPRGT